VVLTGFGTSFPPARYSILVYFASLLMLRGRPHGRFDAEIEGVSAGA